MIGHHPADGAWKGASRRLARWVGVATVGLLVAVSVTAGAAAAAEASADDVDSDGNLSVEISEDSTQPTGTPTPAGSTAAPSRAPATTPSTNNGSSGSVRTAQVTQAIIPEPVAADDALGDDPTVVRGILAMSGLSANASPSIGVGNGHLIVDFVIRNMSSTAFDSTAKFWVDNMFGGRVAEIDDVQVSNLQPDETRRVQVRFESLGQHVLLHVNATLTPPTTLGGKPLEPISRNASVLVPPWFSIAVISGLVALSWLGWRLYTRRAAAVGLQPLPA